MAGRGILPGREIIFEYQRLADSVRLAAIDAATGTEVIVFGPAHVARHDLERVALRKLERRLGLNADGTEKTPRPKGRGVIV
ncbi:hypothetical protein [Glycocaulis sp.]|uniref:DUF6898 family protein n=1 Tax=Glycocaulis sp. TaxID=1969725 RepID=UPI0025BA10B3|nr:hypothetical protein [Glycocaulis sp.]MCH8521102.1 hypothetical protein [Glycocaulis sp.]